MIEVSNCVKCQLHLVLGCAPIRKEAGLSGSPFYCFEFCYEWRVSHTCQQLDTMSSFVLQFTAAQQSLLG